MASRPTSAPRWDNPGVEPPELKKTEGWLAGEQPPAGYFNWFWSLVASWLLWISERTREAGDGIFGVLRLHAQAPDGASGPAIEGYGASTGGDGVVGVGGASGGDGVVGAGGATGGAGVVGRGGPSGPGVHGIGGAPGGSSPLGYGVIAQADASNTFAALRVVPQSSQPSSLSAEGSIYYDAETKKLRVCTGVGVWEDLN